VRILVTGGSGLLGSNLALEFRRAGHAVTALYRQHGFHLPGVVSLPCDLTGEGEMARVLAGAQPDAIVHCAAATNLEWCEKHPGECLRINAEVPGEIAARAWSLGSRMVHISTDAVFDGAAGGYRETDRTAPVNQYGHSKALGEAAVLSAMPGALILRTNIYGWNLQPKTSLAEWALARLERGAPVPGFGDVVFSPVLVNSLAEWILDLLDAGCAGIFHAASRDHASKYDFLRHLAAVFHLDPSLVCETSVADSPLTAPRPHHTWLRADKLAAALARPLPTIREGLESFHALDQNGFAHRLKAAAA
jgi:dTDP-4-dehydrorhamnose reductase